MAEKMRNMFSRDLARPTICQKCGGILVYRGIGEYKCEECGGVEYDDYGKVRNYLEHHRGANVAEISSATDVSHKSIREMIKENRFEVIESRGGFLRCESCGIEIKSGRLCHKCEEAYHRKVEEQARKERQQGLSGYELEMGDKGSKRYKRER